MPKKQPPPLLPGDVAAEVRPGESSEQAVTRLRRESAKLLFETHLNQPFHPNEVKWKTQLVKGNRCLAVAYIDARLVMDRLDDVCGVDGWRDEYELLPSGSVVCRLTLWCQSGMNMTKCDVGSPSEQPDGGDRLKAAFSDALKRAAVKFGIGRYLYRLPMQWVDYDPVKKRLAAVPQLPAFAFPKKDVPDPRPYYDESDFEAQPVAAAATPPAQDKAAAAGDKEKEKAKEPDQKVEAANKKRAEEFAEKRLDWWIAGMDGCETPAQLTQFIAENGKDEPMQTKALVWDRVQTEIKNRGWKWNARAKEAYDPEGPDESVAF